MVEPLSPLGRLVLATRAVRGKVERRRAYYTHWLPSQTEFHRSPKRFKLLRMGNQHSGKTWAGLAEVNWRCLGQHPHLKTRPPPIRAWVVCDSWSQSVTIQRKFWELCDRDQLDPKTVFDDVKGFKGKWPTVRYKNGSIIRFKTGKQGRGGKAAALASDTLDVILIDEPVEQRVFEECRKRVMRRGGVLLMTLTPINGPVDYLRELCEKGVVHDLHYKLDPANLVPVGDHEPIRLWDEEQGRWVSMDGAWCSQLRRDTTEIEVPVTVDGEWEERAMGRTYAAFSPLVHVVDELPDEDWELTIGMDHGVRAHTETAVLMGYRQLGVSYQVVVIDEYVSNGMTTEDEDADGILSMLERRGQRWCDLKVAFGDRAVMSSTGPRNLALKSNRGIMRALARHPRAKHHGIREDYLSPEIMPAKRGVSNQGGAVSVGCNWIHKLMLRPNHFLVHRRCRVAIKHLPRYRHTVQNSEEAHICDGIRYGLRDLIFEKRSSDTGPELVIGGGS